MLDTNFDDMSAISVYDDVKEEKTVFNLKEDDITKDSWDSIRKLVVMQVKFGLEESMNRGLYSDQVVKTAMALLKQADKTFDEDAASEITSALEKFRNANKTALRAHKDSAINAKVQ